jgi:hypothetical protein
MNHSDRITFNALAAPVLRRRARWLAATIGALVIGTASAALPLKTIEECLESGTDLVRLPGVAGGSLAASQCSGCPSVRLRFDARTRYFIGKEPVTYARLREAAAKGDLQLDLFYDPKTLNLTRLRLAAAGNDK